MKITSLTVLLILTSLLSLHVVAQERANNYLQQLKNQDISTLWRDDSLAVDGGAAKVKYPEPLGFIGSAYQRFFIHFTSVRKNGLSPYQYTIEGKTRVKNNICPFRGTLTLRQAKLLPQSDETVYRQGIVIASIRFLEDTADEHTGIFEGAITTSFFIDSQHRVRYDALMSGADGFSNNACVATWTSYNKKLTKNCNWGDYRIPKCGDLDEGAGQFVVNKKYIKNGWENYEKAWLRDAELPETKKAQELENRHWWE